jgi:hypothetical protein
VTHVHTYSVRNRIIPLMRRLNTDSTPNKPVTLPRNQLLIRYAVTNPVHTVTIRCYDTQVTLQVCTHPYESLRRVIVTTQLFIVPVQCASSKITHTHTYALNIYVYSHCPTYVRVAFRGTLRKSEFPSIPFFYPTRRKNYKNVLRNVLFLQL